MHLFIVANKPCTASVGKARIIASGKLPLRSRMLWVSKQMGFCEYGLLKSVAVKQMTPKSHHPQKAVLV